MGPEGMETSAVMANLVGSENVPRELLGTARASAPALELWSHTDPLPSLQGLQGEVSACSSQVLPAEPHFCTWSLPGAPKSRRKEMWPGEGGGAEVPKKKRCSRSGMQMKGP